MQSTTENRTESASVLARLRALTPRRPLKLNEALRVAELQASYLLALTHIHETPVPTEVVSDLPRIRVEYDFDMPDQASGASDWDYQARSWIITINGHQPQTRQRFTVLHEYKHILDHGHPGLQNSGSRLHYGLPPVEYIADYFAGCALMPRLLLKRAWGNGVQDLRELAARFDVCERAMEVRLTQVGLIPTSRCEQRPAQARPQRNAANSAREGRAA